MKFMISKHHYSIHIIAAPGNAKPIYSPKFLNVSLVGINHASFNSFLLLTNMDIEKYNMKLVNAVAKDTPMIP